jgi:mono/diheme cytochrome c family protein
MKKVAAVVVVAVAGTALLWTGCGASSPGRLETLAAGEAKKVTIGGKDWKNPTPDTPEAAKAGAEHFQHHCQICHGLDGQNTGVPFADKMSPPVASLADKRVQDYADGQLKWIMDNGIRFTGMPGWKGILDDNEMWSIVRYIRHLPQKGSLGAPAVFSEAEEEHEHAEHGERPAQGAKAGETKHAPDESKPHTHDKSKPQH